MAKGSGPSKPGSSGKHGGGHKDRQRAADASDRKAAQRALQKKLDKERKGGNASGSGVEETE